MNRENTIFIILSFILPFIIYIITLAPDVMFTDSGELAGVCVTLGVPHSTGYPLFTLIGFMWSLIPLGIPKITQMNLFSAFLTSLAMPIFFLVSKEVISLFLENIGKINQINIDSKKEKISKNITKTNFPNINLNLSENEINLISLFSVLILAFGKTIWGQATSIEVYSLQVLFYNLLIYFLLKIRKINKISKLSLLLAFATGLSFANHMNTILLVPAIIYMIIFGLESNKIQISFKDLLILSIIFVLGLSLYLYLPLRASTYPEFNWGWVHRGFDKFLYHVSGRQYQIWMFSELESIPKNFNIFINSLPFEFGIIGLIPLIYGIYKSFLFKRFFYLILIIILSCLFYALNYSIHDINNYFILAYIGLTIFLIVGIAFIVNSLKNNRKIIYLFLIIPIISLVSNYSISNESNNYLVADYTKILTDNLEENAIIISRQWDYFCSAFWYKQKVENYRKDIILIEKELLRRTWYLEEVKRKYKVILSKSTNEIQLFQRDLELFEAQKTGYETTIQTNYENMIKSIIDNNIDSRPIYVTFEIYQEINDLPFLKDYNQIPTGFAIKIEKKSSYTPPIKLKNLDYTRFINSYKNPENHLEKGIVEFASVNITNMGIYSFYKLNDKKQAMDFINKALEINPNNLLAQQHLSKIRAAN